MPLFIILHNLNKFKEAKAASNTSMHNIMHTKLSLKNAVLMIIVLFIIITNKLKKSIIDTLFYARNHKIVYFA